MVPGGHEIVGDTFECSAGLYELMWLSSHLQRLGSKPHGCGSVFK